jgi:hypothetical protein
MSVKHLLGAVAASGFMLLAGAANAGVATYSTASAYMGAFTTDPTLINSVQDNVDWGIFADTLQTPRDNGSIQNGKSLTTTGAHGGETVTVTSGNNTTFTTYIQPGTSTATGHWKGDFAANTNVLFTAGTSMTIGFSSAVTGLGLDLQTNDTGSYTFQLQAFNTSGVSLGTAVSNAANSTGSSIFNASKLGTAGFAGITSTAADISYVTITLLTDKGSAVTVGNQGTGFAIDTSLIFHNPVSQTSGGGTQTTPEPGTLALLGAGLAGLGAVRRRRNRAA